MPYDMMPLFNFETMKMVKHADFDLNSVHQYTDSYKEVIKQTILKQEIIFRTQVHELHQLYMTQKSLMNDLGYMGRDGYITCDSKAQSSLPPFANPTRYELLVKETGFSSRAQVGSTPIPSQELSDGCQDAFHRPKKRPLDLHVSACEFINHVGEDPPKKGNAWNHLKEFRDFKHCLSANYSSDTEGLKLSLITGDDNRRIDSTLRACLYKDTRYFPVIDLESDESITDDHAKFKPSVGCAPQGTCSIGQHQPQVSAFSGLVFPTTAEKDPSAEIAESSSCQKHSKCCQEQTYSNEGVMECHDGMLRNNLSAKMQQSTLHQEVLLDLNKVYLDDSSCFSNDPVSANPSPASSAGISAVVVGSIQEKTCPATFWNKESHNCSNETSDMLPQDNFVNGSPIDLNTTQSTDIWARNSKHNEITGSVVNIAGAEPMTNSPVGIFEDLGSCSGNHKNHNVELKVKHANGLSHDSNQMSVAIKELSSKKIQVEDTVFSCNDESENDGHGNQSPASCKSGIYDYDSNSGKVMHSGSQYGDVSTDSKNHLKSKVADLSSDEHNPRISNSCDLNNECYSKKEELAEIDSLMKGAAELLINMSLENLDCFHQVSSAEKGSDEVRYEKREQPQYTCDSFELMVMNLTESNVDDNSVTSKPYEVNDLETKDIGSKLRRGRRMKDFQKEILPALASLSRHEIHEDINIIEGVLRSREYRKIRGKMVSNGENWSPLARSRRSRLNYVGRRNFSWKLS